MLFPHLCRPAYASNILQKAFQTTEDFEILYTYRIAPIANVNWNFHIQFHSSWSLPVFFFEKALLNQSAFPTLEGD